MKVFATVETPLGTMPDPGPSDEATRLGRGALAARMASGPDNTVPRAAPVDKDRYAANPALRIG